MMPRTPVPAARPVPRPAPRRARPRRKWPAQLVVAILALVPAWFILTTDPRVPTSVKTQAALLWVLCFIPSWDYFSRQSGKRPPLPFLPVVGMLFGVYFALPIIAPVGFLPAGRLTINATTEYTRPVLVALVGWISLGASYLLMGHLYRPSRPDPKMGWHPDVIRRWGFVMLYGGLVVEMVRREFYIPSILRGALFFSATLAWFGAALLVVLATQGRLSRPAKLAVAVAVLAGITIQLTGGLTSYVAVWVGVVFLSVWIGRGSLPRKWILSLVVAALLLLAVRSVIEEFRNVAWFTRSMTFTERIEFAYVLIDAKIRTEGLVDSAVEGWTKSGRWGTIDIYAHVVRETPERIPYWNGETYYSLVGMAVPRVLWPSKPNKMLGQEFGHRYNFLLSDDVRTSINLPYFVEFYANFGFFGVLIGMAIVGAIYRVLQRLVNAPGQSPLMSIVGLILLFPLFNIESDFSLTFGGLLLNGLATYMVLRFLARRSALATYEQAAAAQRRRTLGRLQTLHSPG